MTLTEILQTLEACVLGLRAIIDAQPTHLLDVPFRSQEDDDAKWNKSDCGPACVAMLLEYAGVRVDINTLAREAGMSTTKRYTLPADLIRAANLHGLKIERRTDCTIGMLRSAIALHCPPIVLIHYGSLGTLRQDQAWNGGHWIVVVGVSDDTIYVHDPDWQGEQRHRGQNLAIPRTIFEDAWAKCNLDTNIPHQGLWVVGASYRNETGGTTITPAMGAV